MFGTFGHYKKWADSEFSNWPPLTSLIIASCLTGSTEAILTPLERVQMLLQDRKYHKDYRNTIDTLIRLRQFGVKEYYRGLTCVLMRNGPSNVLFFGLRDEIKKLMPSSNNYSQLDIRTSNKSNPSFNYHDQSSPSSVNNNNVDNYYEITGQKQYQQQQLQSNTMLSIGNTKENMLHDFLSGALLGMFISTCFYPLSVVRTRMQTRAPGTEFLSIVKAFNVIYNERDRKLSRLFHGCLINVMRQFISWGVINCSYEYVLNLLHSID